MASILDGSLPRIAEQTDLLRDQKKISRLWSRGALGAIALLSIFLNFFQLGQNGYGNLYYAAGIKSMGDSWHNFFFVSFDPGGFVTIDKPPLGFWLQTLSTKIFGFTAFSLFLPQALCGVLAVLLLYTLVRRHFGVVAGLIAALALALSPVSVVTDRNNTIDGTLALVLLLAAWAIIRAAESGKLRWLLLSAAFVGIGFNIKMAEAYLVVPALGLTYLLCAPRKIITRIWHLALALLVMLVISLSWAAAVDLTPAAQRPYVGSTQNNSELSLAFGYNGLNRLHIGTTGFGGAGGTRQNGRPGGGFGGFRNGNGNSGSANTSGGFGGFRNGNGNSGNASNSGATGNAANLIEQLGAGFRAGSGGPLSLIGSSMGGQIGWLLPFALLAIVALAWQRRPRFQRDRQQLALVLWGCWLLTMAIFFTLDGSFHQYYLTEMAPGLSAMVGIGLVVMWNDYRRTGWRGWLLPLAFVLTAAAQIFILINYPSWSQWMSPVIGTLTLIAALALIFLRLRSRSTSRSTKNWNWSSPRISGIVVGIGLVVLLLAPTIWSGYSVIQNVENSDPTAGPGASGIAVNRGSGAGIRGGQGIAALGSTFASAFAGFLGGGSGQANPQLVSYLEAHQGTTKFLVATANASTAESLILTTNKPVMAMGGFSGSDPILTTSQLQTLIHNGTVRFFLVSSSRATQALADAIPEQYRSFLGSGGFGGGGFGQSTLSNWISTNCRPVPAQNWQSSTQGGGGLGGSQLYDCAASGS